MPTLFIINGFRFFFYSNESMEPPHIHVKKGNAEGKIWIEPNFEISYLHGFTGGEEKDILKIVEANFENIKLKWHEYFDK